MPGTFQGLVAYASCVVNSGPPGAVTIQSQSGDFEETPTTPIYTASGQYTLTLATEISPNDCVYQITCRAPSGKVRVASVVAATATSIDIEVLDETPSNEDPDGFDIAILVRPAN